MSLKVAVKKRFKGFELDVAFESDGAPLGILGASGSGKSMTLKCIAGIETPDAGHIEVNGRVLFDSRQKINIRPQQRKIGYLFQSYALFPHMTVEQNIACALPGPRQQKKALVEALLERYRLAGLGQRFPSQLSGGQQQRVALARILAYEPEVLLLDEPFSALDAYLKEALQIEMMELLGGYGGDAVMVTHNRDEVYKLSENLLVLEGGRAAALGPTRQMFERPERLAVARLTGCKNYSRARRLGDDEVEALDWGCRLAVAGPVPEDLTHVGVRAHYFTPCEGGARNALAVKLHKEVENPFEWNLLFYAAAGERPAQEIWWMVPKAAGGRPAAVPEFLCVSPQNVLLLRA